MPRRRMWSIPAWAGGCRAIPRRSMAPSISTSTPPSAMTDPTIRCQDRAIFGDWRAECEPSADGALLARPARHVRDRLHSSQPLPLRRLPSFGQIAGDAVVCLACNVEYRSLRCAPVAAADPFGKIVAPRPVPYKTGDPLAQTIDPQPLLSIGFQK